MLWSACTVLFFAVVCECKDERCFVPLARLLWEDIKSKAPWCRHCIRQ